MLAAFLFSEMNIKFYHDNYRGTGYWNRAIEAQMDAMTEFCRDRHLLDLGGWNGSLADLLLRHGAASADVLDKSIPIIKSDHPKIHWWQYTFAQFLDWPVRRSQFDVGLLSWPANVEAQMPALICILRSCSHIVYLGKNDGCTMCGTPRLWSYLITRSIVAHIPDRDNVLLIYGPEIASRESLVEEEMQGLSAYHELAG